ncbi:hypothetical protein NFI96_022142 [Prochilodus magdalenae]|nr:hypothetical protein NFI96_022142 [Prochilodus magdalenae]
MAVKRIRSTVDEKEQKQLLMDLDVVMRSSDCPYIVQFYGALFREVCGHCLILTISKHGTTTTTSAQDMVLKLMSTSLDKFYKYVYSTLEGRDPGGDSRQNYVSCESCFLTAPPSFCLPTLSPLTSSWTGMVTLSCVDFGISGQLVDSIAKDLGGAGCRPYMAVSSVYWSMGAP